MEIANAKQKYVFETRIDLEDGDYVTLREPSSLELKELGHDEDKNFAVLYRIFDTCLIDHSFTDGAEKASNKDVVTLLKASGTTFMGIIVTWMNSLPLAQRSSKK